MTREEARQLVTDYDDACADCERRPKSEAARKRYWSVYNRLLDRICGDETTDPLPGRAP